MLLNLPIGTNISHCLINLTADLYCAVLPDICLGQLQHISCNWKDIARHLSSFGSFENLFGSGIRLCFTARSFQLEKYLWNFCSVNWDDPLFLLLLEREPAKNQRSIFSVITGTVYFDVPLLLQFPHYFIFTRQYWIFFLLLIRLCFIVKCSSFGISFIYHAR